MWIINHSYKLKILNFENYINIGYNTILFLKLSLVPQDFSKIASQKCIFVLELQLTYLTIEINLQRPLIDPRSSHNNKIIKCVDN